MFGPLVRSTDPGSFYALDPEAAVCVAYRGTPLVLAIGTVGFRDQGRTGKRHALLLYGSMVSILRGCLLSRGHLGHVGEAGPGDAGEEIEGPDPEADALLDLLLAPVDVVPMLRPEGVEFLTFGDNPDDTEVDAALVSLDESGERYAYLLHASFIEAMYEVLKAGSGARAVLRAETPYRELFGVPPA